MSVCARVSAVPLWHSSHHSLFAFNGKMTGFSSFAWNVGFVASLASTKSGICSTFIPIAFYEQCKRFPVVILEQKDYDLLNYDSRSPEWNQISQQKRQELGLVFEDDGEFWMAFDDFCQHFSSMSICRLIYTSIVGSIMSGGAKHWSEGVFKGAWKRPDKCGGCANNRESFFQNPQYRFDVATDDEQVLIGLSQKDIRHLRAQGGKHLAIGFYVMRIECNRKTRVRLFKDKAGASQYMETRMVTLRMNLKPGRYCIIPTTFAPGEEGEFLLRIYTSYDCNAGVLDTDLPKQKMMGVLSMGSIDAQCLTTIGIRQVNGLAPGKSSLPDPFVTLECEGKTAKTPVVRNSVDPVYNETAIFYRKSLSSPIKVQIFNQNLMKNALLGECILEASEITNGQLRQFQLPLHGKDNPGSPVHGVIVLELTTYDDLAAV